MRVEVFVNSTFASTLKQRLIVLLVSHLLLLTHSHMHARTHSHTRAYILILTHTLSVLRYSAHSRVNEVIGTGRDGCQLVLVPGLLLLTGLL
jgi:hypothetical protein